MKGTLAIINNATRGIIMNSHVFKRYEGLGIAGCCLLLATAANAAKPDKIDVCHAPPTNPDRIQLIQVGPKGGALDDHLSHGDWLVSEEMCDAIADNNCDGIPGAPAEDDADCVAQNSEGYTCEAGACLPPPEPPLLGKCTGKLQQFTLIWNGPGPVNIAAASGTTSTSGPINNGDTVTFFGPYSNNDVVVDISGAVSGQSEFHVSCSDENFNSPDDCGKLAGNGKSDSSSLLNLWLLEGMLDADGLRLVCDFDPTT